MSVTVDVAIRRVPGIAAFLLFVLMTVGAPPARAAVNEQPPAGDRPVTAIAHEGGEANLVLPDLSTVDFRGVNGRTLDYQIADDRYTVDGGKQAANQLVNDYKPFLISGTLGIDHIFQVASAAHGAGVRSDADAICAEAGHGGLTSPGSSPRVMNTTRLSPCILPAGRNSGGDTRCCTACSATG